MYPPIPSSWGEDTHSALDSVGEQLANVEATVLTDISSKLDNVESSINNVANVLLGSMGVALGKIERPIGAAYTKVRRAIDSTVDAMYGHLNASGVPYPDVEEVRFDNAIRGVTPIGDNPPSPIKPSPPPNPIGGDITPAFIPPPGSLPPIHDPYGNPPPVTPPQPILPPGGIHPPLPVINPPSPPIPPAGINPPGNSQCPGGGPADYCYKIVGTDCIKVPVNADGSCPVGYIPHCIGWGGGCHTPEPINPPPTGQCYPAEQAPPAIGGGNLLYCGLVWPPDGVDSPANDTALYSPCQSWSSFNSPSPYIQACDAHGIFHRTPGGYGYYDDGVQFRGCAPIVPGMECNVPPQPIPPDQQPPPGEQCKPIPAPPCSPKGDGKFPPKPKGGSDACESLATEAETFGATNANISDFIGIAIDGAGLGTIGKAIAEAIMGSDKPIIPGIANRLAKWIQQAIHTTVSMLDCEEDKVANIAIFQLFCGLIKQYAGFFPHQPIDVLQQMSNTVCQSKLPGSGEADLAYLRGEIDKKTWECYHKANGDHLQDFEHIMQAGRAKLDPTQLDRLYRRKFIDQPTYDKLSREAGVLNDVDKKNIHDLNQAFPTLSDVILLMNRDVANDTTVDWSEADALFDANYKGKVKDWYDANGVDRELALFNWRAHFHIPSYTMGQQMLFRGREDVVGKEHSFSREDFRQMLIQDDWHPAFIDRMIDVSYHVVSKTDAIRAYMQGTIDETDLYSRFMDNGYKSEDAEFYTKYYQTRRTVENRKIAGMPTARRLVQSYARCEITESDFRDTIAKIVVTEEQELDAIDAAKVARKIENRKRSIRSIRRPYVLGIIDDSEVQELMDAADIQGECRDELLQAWNLDRMRRDKTLAAGTLCDMISRGIITADKYVSALVRNGYTAEDANAMLLLCGAKLTEKQQKAAEQLARRIAAQQEKDRKAAEKARKLAECGPPDCPKNTPGGKEKPPIQAL